MSKKINTISIYRLRSYSTAFSRSGFLDILNYGDFNHLDWIYDTYDKGIKEYDSYFDYIQYIYSTLTKSYRCEYIIKNEIINQLLLKKYGKKETVAFNEFHVGDSIVDLAMMNGESKAFEIKTELDSPQRLSKQMNDYKKIFDKCYIVIPADKLGYYEDKVDSLTGIITFSFTRGRIKIEESRPAQKRESLDPDIIMKCLRTQEYQNIITHYYGFLPKVKYYEMYDACSKQMRGIPFKELRRLVLSEFKNRKTTTPFLDKCPKDLRQIILSLNLTEKKTNNLIINLHQPINNNIPCISHI